MGGGNGRPGPREPDGGDDASGQGGGGQGGGQGGGEKK